MQIISYDRCRKKTKTKVNFKRTVLPHRYCMNGALICSTSFFREKAAPTKTQQRNVDDLFMKLLDIDQ